MNRVRDTPVEDRIRVPEVRVAVEGARSFPAPDAHAVAVAAPVATEPAPRLVEPASGDRIAVRATGPSGTRVESTPCARSASLAYGPGVRDAPAALRVPWEAGSAARPPRDDSSVAVLTPDPPDGRP
ncbi:hypothetical protein ACF1BE_30270 [Streptomyces sp. NPDC014991]|uniref:hypothetical protein n=1 Tax=Streptomyces sp. NPDC014991 TaxID=3364935 RepID=UPI0036F8BB5E